LTEKEIQSPRASDDEAVLQQQYLRAMSSFEGIILGQIKVKNDLGNRLNKSIRAGLVILSLIAFSILILLLMLSLQVNRITNIVGDMNEHFTSVSVKMADIKVNMHAMESQVALMSDIEQYTTIMNSEMINIASNMNSMDSSVEMINEQFGSIRQMISGIAVITGQMNSEVQQINHEMHRMSEPARSINKIFPMP